MSELRDQGTDLPRETGSVVRDGSGAGDVPVHAGDNPTMSLSELYERRDQREAAAGAGTSDEGAAADEGVRETEASAGVADESSDAGYPVYKVGYPADAGTSHEGFDGHATNEIIDRQVVSDPVTGSDPVPDWEAGNRGQQPESVGDAGPVPGDGGRGAGDERFSGWPDTEPAVAAAGDATGERKGAAGGQETDGSPGFFGRVGELQDQGAVESGERDGDGRTGPGTRTSADTSQQGERGEETGGEKDAEGQGEDSQDQKPKDLAPVQHPAPDAETDRPVETSAETVPDQQPDDPRMAAMEARMERMMATVEAMREKLEASEARHEEDKAGLEQRLGDLQAENSELKQKVAEATAGRREGQDDPGRLPESFDEHPASGDREITEPLVRPDAHGTDDDPDAADFVEAASTEADKEARKVPEIADRPGFSEETRDAASSAAGLGGTVGFLNPAVGLVMGADAARRAYEKMSPDEQYDAMRMTDSALTALGGMSPGTMVAAVTLSMMVPTLQDGFKNMYHKLKRKD